MKIAEEKSSIDPDAVYEFGDYRLDARRRALSHRTRGPIAVTSRVFDTLLHLVENHGRVVAKRQLLDAVWGDVVVEENNLTQAISALRQILGERPDEHRFLVTVPGRGYRFIAPVSQVEQPPPGSDTQPHIAAVAVAVPARRHWAFLAAIGIVTLIVVVVLAWVRLSRSAESAIRTIAVMPFKPLVPADSNPALELGMADALIMQLSNSRGMIVRPLSSVRKYADVQQDPLAAGRALGVDAVLDGSIQRAGDALRVTVRLMRVKDGASIWVEKIDQQWSDVFRVQDAIAGQVVSALELQLTNEGRQRLTQRGTESAEAYRLYLLGRYHVFKLRPLEIDKGIGYFSQAIDADPKYALAYAGLAEASRALAITSDRRPTQVLPQGKAAALRALALDERLDEAQASLCFIQVWSDWDWTAAERSCKRAIELNPNGVDGHRAYAILLSDLGRHEQAIAEARRATQLDPLSLITNAIEGHVLHYAGRDNEAMERLQATLDLEADFWIAHLFIGKVHLRQGRLDEALREFEKAKQFSGGNSEAVSLIGYTLARKGDPKGAEAVIEELRSRMPEQYVPPFNIAMIYNALEDRDRTFEWLEKAYAERDVRLTFLKVEWKWDALRDDPRFAALAGRVGLD